MGRDEGLAQFVMEMLLRVLMNISVGLLTAVLFFLGNVYSIIRMYGGGIFGFVFFLCCALSGAAFLATSYTLIFGSAAVAGISIYNAALPALQERARNAERLRGE